MEFGHGCGREITGNEVAEDGSSLHVPLKGRGEVSSRIEVQMKTGIPMLKSVNILGDTLDVRVQVAGDFNEAGEVDTFGVGRELACVGNGKRINVWKAEELADKWVSRWSTKVREDGGSRGHEIVSERVDRSGMLGTKAEGRIGKGKVHWGRRAAVLETLADRVGTRWSRLRGAVRRCILGNGGGWSGWGCWRKRGVGSDAGGSPVRLGNGGNDGLREHHGLGT